MPYELIGLVGSLGLAAYFVLRADASARSKWGVALLESASLVIWFRFPRWVIIAILLQAVVSVSVLLYFRLSGVKRFHSKESRKR